MSNVIHLNVPSQRQTQQARFDALLSCFAGHRRFGDDVFWLKENAELLNILECTGTQVDDSALAAHEGFYAQVEKRLGFFPQYYRFLLSICLDLEDLGMPGHKGTALAAWIDEQGLVEAELSDLQRAEARRLLARRGIDPLPHDPGLTDRLHRFIGRSDTFTMPNKKAAYELTHIVFYLSEYGRKDPGLAPEAITSLEFAGILAYLDQNSDLLAEICIALRFAAQTPSEIWESWLDRETSRFVMQHGDHISPLDDYHDYFVCNWHRAVAGGQIFSKSTRPGRMAFLRGDTQAGPLRDISECMFQMEGNRSPDWHDMQGHIENALTEVGYDILTEARVSTAKFDDFFAGFARTGLTGAPV